MKRPFAVVGITYLIAQTVAVLCGMAATAAMFCITVLCAFVLLILVKSRPAWLMPVLLSCAVCFALNGMYMFRGVKPTISLEGNTVMLSGRVCRAPICSDGRYNYIIEADEILTEDAPSSVRIRLSCVAALDAEYGDRISAEVRILYSDRASYTYRNLLADGVTLSGVVTYGSEVQITEGEPSLYRGIIRLRNRFSLAAKSLMGDELGGLLTGMTTGDTSEIDSTEVRMFRDSGLSHLFAVSGLHLALMLKAVLALFRRLTSNYRIASAAGIPFVLFFMAFAGFSGSIMRAGIMMLLYLTAMAVKREADGLNSLGIAALIVCLAQPCAAADAGVLMSFSASAGISMLYPAVNKWLRGAVRFDPQSRWAFAIRPILTVTTSSIIATVCTFPISVLCFGQMSLVGPMANVLCIYPVSGFIITGSLAAALSCVPVIGTALGYILFVPAWLCGRLIIVIARLMAGIPGAGVAVNYPFMAIMLVMWLGLTLLYVILFVKDRQRSVSAILCGALCVQMLMMGAAVHNSMRLSGKSVTVHDADGGSMVSLVSGGQCVLIGAGGDSYHSYLASNELFEDNIIDAVAVVLPEYSERYTRSALEMIEQYRPDNVFVCPSGSRYEPIIQLCRKIGADVYDARNAEFAADGCGISFRCYTDAEGGVWLWGECGVTVLVCPEEGDCLLLPEQLIRPDVAVVPDSKLKNITCIDPAAVVVCAEDHQRAHERAVLEYRGMKNVYAVDDDGCISFERKGNGLAVMQH